MRAYIFLDMVRYFRAVNLRHVGIMTNFSRFLFVQNRLLHTLIYAIVKFNSAINYNLLTSSFICFM